MSKSSVSVLKGKMEMYLNDTEKHVLVPGDVLNFDGVNFIKGTALVLPYLFLHL